MAVFRRRLDATDLEEPRVSPLITTKPNGPTSLWGSVPQPDPTVLTATAVAQAKQDLRRELAAQRELIDQRIDGIVNELHIVAVELKQAPQEREKLRERLSVEANVLTDNVQNELRILASKVSNAHDEHDDLRRRLQTDIQVAVDNLRNLHQERFAAIQQQFDERDTRGEQEKKASKEALDAALLAQKESVSQQNDANTTAATKTETNFTKQIDLVGTQITALDKSLTDRISELKERIDRGEGQNTGSRQMRDEHRLDIAGMLQAVAVIVAFISVIVILFHK